MRKGDAEDNGPPTCCEVTQSLGPTRPFSPIASCLSHNVSSTRRPRWRAWQTSSPFQQWPPQHPPSTTMPSQPSPSALCVTTPTPSAECPFHGKVCYNCGGQNHYTALCWQNYSCHCHPHDSRARLPRQSERSPLRESRSTCNWPCNRHRSSHSSGRHSSHSQNQSPSHSPSPYCYSQSPRWHRRSTPFWCHEDSIKIVPAPSLTNSNFELPQRRLPFDRVSIRWTSHLLYLTAAPKIEWDEDHNFQDWPRHSS